MSTPTASAEDEKPLEPMAPDLRLFRSILATFKADKSNPRIEVFIINGIKLMGRLIDFDDEGMLIDSPTQGLSLIRRSAISTIVLKRPVQRATVSAPAPVQGNAADSE